MKRDALLRELRQIARERDLDFELVEGRGKGSHYRVRVGTRWTTVKSGDLTNTYIGLIKKQLGLR